MPTAEDHIRKSNIHTLANGLDAISFVDIIKGLIPRTIVTTGLESLAAQPLVDSDGETPVYGAVGTVTDSSDTGLTKILAGAVGAGEVLVTYDADGRPALTFNAAVTGYKVEMHHTLPATLSSVLLAKSM